MYTNSNYQFEIFLRNVFPFRLSALDYVQDLRIINRPTTARHEEKLLIFLETIEL